MKKEIAFILFALALLLCLYPAYTKAEGEYYTLVTDVSQLEEQDEIIFVSHKQIIDVGRCYYAMTTDFGSAQVSLSGNMIASLPCILPMALVEANGGWRLSVGSTYLAINGNSLNTVSNAADATVWSISVSSDTATISSNGVSVCYDGATFCCGSGGNPVAIYKEDKTPHKRCGSNAYWEYDDEVLTITGYGDVMNCLSFLKNRVKEVVIGDGITSIEDYVFSDFVALQTVNLPNSIISIGEGAFKSCTSLASITLPNGLQNIDSEAFSECISLRFIAIPDTVSEIGIRAFENCTGLKSLTIGNGVSRIENHAFSNCSYLVSITLPCSIEVCNNAFENCIAISNVHLTKGTGVWNDNNFYCPWKTNQSKIRSIIIDAGIKNIVDYAFFGCVELESVTMGEDVEDIGEHAFEGCTGLTSVTIPDNVTSIGNSAFKDCTGLTSVTLPCSIKVGNYSFSNCNDILTIHLTKGNGIWTDDSNNMPWMINESMKRIITLDEGITSIGEGAFCFCTGLQSITIPNGVKKIGNFAFQDCTGLTSITIPDSVTSIGEFAFSDCTGLKSAIIGANVTSIGYQAFSYCTELMSITIPNNVSRIDYCAFLGCTGLTSISIQCSISSIGAQLFCGCTGIRSITIPDSVTSIDDFAFQGCTGLISIIIPNSITIIRGGAFDGCIALKDVYYMGSIEQKEQIVFPGNDNEPLLYATWHYQESLTSSPTPTSTPTPTPTPVPTPTPEPATMKKVQAKKSVKLQAPKVKKATYQWMYRTGKFGAWQTLGKKGSKQKLSAKATIALDGYQYRCRVTSPTGSVTFTDIYELYVYEPLKVKKQPKWGKASLPGSKMTLSVTATGASEYQWLTRPNGSAAWAKIEGATGTSYVVEVKEGMAGYQYACQISGKQGTAMSKAATVKMAKVAAPKIKKQPVWKKAVNPGERITLSVTAQNAETYQWYYRTTKNGAWIIMGGETKTTVTFPAPANGNGYQYKCTAKGKGGTVDSKPVTLKVVTP